MTSPRIRLGDSNDPRLEAQQAGTGTRDYSAIPEPSDDNTQEVLKALKESVEGILGSRGGLQSNGVLVEDLESLGLITVEDNGFVRNTVNNFIPKVLDILKATYPVGTVYVSIVSTNPATLIGIGTWSRIGTGTMLVDGGTGFTEGTTGGQATSDAHGHGAGTLVTGAQSQTQTIQSGTGDTAPGNTHTHGISGSVANNSPTTDDNYPPYLAVYMWKRTA